MSSICISAWRICSLMAKISLILDTRIIEKVEFEPNKAKLSDAIFSNVSALVCNL